MPKLEKTFGITLPAKYVAAVTTILKTCTDWPEQYKSWGDRLFTDTDRLLELNRDCRKNPAKFVRTPASIRKQWPNELFLFGGSPEMYWCFNTTEANPILLNIHQKRLEGCSQFKHFSDLIESIKYAYNGIRKVVKQRTGEEVQRRKWLASQKSKKKPAGRPDLISEGWKLGRPALRLRTEGKQYAAVWGGTGVVPPPTSGEWHHWISVACAHLPVNPRKLNGVFSVYERLDDDYGTVRVVHRPTLRLPRFPNGEKLYGAPFTCLPSIGVVLSQGSKTVRQWMRDQGIWSGDAESARFRDQEPVDAYIAQFQANHPFFLNDCDAMLGGWHIVFPDSRWPQLMKQSLLVSTFRDAEPWMEVYDTGSALRGYHRVT